MVRALSALLLLFCTACGLAEDGRDEDNKYIYIKFYDKAFEAYCLEKFDTSGDGRISRYEAQRVRRMSCPGLGIGSLTDIREFFNLRELDCSGNELTQLDLTGPAPTSNGSTARTTTSHRSISTACGDWCGWIAAATACRASICIRPLRC